MLDLLGMKVGVTGGWEVCGGLGCLPMVVMMP